MAQSEVQKHIDALKDRDRSVRADAARALGEIGPDAKDAVPALIKALNDKDVDLIAVWALGEIGPAARASVLAIAQWLKKAQSSCRCNIRQQLPCLPEETRMRLRATCHSSNGKKDRSTTNSG